MFYEAVNIKESALRKCMIASWKDLLSIDFDSKFSVPVGALLVIIPKNFETLSEHDKEVSSFTFVPLLIPLFVIQVLRNFGGEIRSFALGNGHLFHS